MGTQKNFLIETVLLSTHSSFEHPKHMLKLMAKKRFYKLLLKIFVYLNLCGLIQVFAGDYGYFAGFVVHWHTFLMEKNKIRPNKKKQTPMFRVTGPYLNFVVKPRIFFRYSGKKYNFMHFERRNKITFFSKCLSKCIKLYFFQKKICVPTLPKIFRLVTRNTLIFYFA